MKGKSIKRINKISRLLLKYLIIDYLKKERERVNYKIRK